MGIFALKIPPEQRVQVNVPRPALVLRPAYDRHGRRNSRDVVALDFGLELLPPSSLFRVGVEVHELFEIYLPWKAMYEPGTTTVRESSKLASRGNLAVHRAAKSDEMPPHVPPHSGTELPRSSRETPATFGGARLVLSGRPATFDHPRTWSAKRAFERANFRPNTTDTDGESLRTARPVPSGQKTEIIHPSRGPVASRLSRGPLAPRTAATGARRDSRAPPDEVGRNLDV